jgi:signal transduction histidine kinase
MDNVLMMLSDDAPPHQIRILHLEDSIADHELVRLALLKSGEKFELERVETLDAFEKLLDDSKFDAILADYRLLGFTALDAWQILQKRVGSAELGSIPFILLSGAIGEPAAVSAIKIGISDYLAKDNLSRLTQSIHRAIEIHNVRREKEAADMELALSERRLADFAEHLQTTIELERTSIAREIHDDIGGALAAIRFDLSWISRRTVDPMVLDHVTAATEMLQHALEASQRIMLNLRPAILDQGLVAAIQWLAKDFTKRTGIETAVHATPDKGTLPKSVALTAYRTAQEALTNIAKHAQCDKVLIDISDAENVLTLEIQDNGQGISQQAREKPKSFGLKGLQERAKTAGGWMDVSTRLNQGTSIILSVPFLPLEVSSGLG